MRAAYLHTDIVVERPFRDSACFTMAGVGISADFESLEGFFMNYKKNYDDYVSYVKSQHRYKMSRYNPSYVYYEKHHVIPRCLGGKDTYDNLVLLTAREHYLAHYLLTKIYPSNQKILFAFCQMHHGRAYDRLGYFNSSLYQVSKERFSQQKSLAIQGSVPWWLNTPEVASFRKEQTVLSNRSRVWSVTSRMKLSQSLKGKCFLSPEGRKRISVSSAGRRMSESLKQKLRSRFLGVPKWYDLPSCIPIFDVSTGVYYKSQAEAGRVVGATVSSIKYAVKKGVPCKGHILRRGSEY